MAKPTLPRHWTESAVFDHWLPRLREDVAVRAEISIEWDSYTRKHTVSVETLEARTSDGLELELTRDETQTTEEAALAHRDAELRAKHGEPTGMPL